METLLKYFPDLPTGQVAQLEQLAELVRDWNARVNLVSRKDIDALEVHHILHSLVIARWIRFVPGTQVLDLGTGGGFPGLPLAVVFPECRFHLVDARGKKVKAVQDMISQLGLINATAEHVRVEDMSEQCEFVVTRAVAPLDQLIRWTRKRINPRDRNALPNGIIALKGGNLNAELEQARKNAYVEVQPVQQLIDHPYFEGKVVVYVQR
ncbi:MAG: 16S rRNA (guanine(527)-N(7))-methyltransferase RsmG [Saprospiraceae bacterium]|nr:16S rRNA (guanine(527)-N(7))-methyltransferase RsmG [Saprospiraceae bacterium]